MKSVRVIGISLDGNGVDMQAVFIELDFADAARGVDRNAMPDVYVGEGHIDSEEDADRAFLVVEAHAGRGGSVLDEALGEQAGTCFGANIVGHLETPNDAWKEP